MRDGRGTGHGARLRLARRVRGFSQQQLAGMARVSRQAVSRVESGASDPSLRIAFALAAALGMTVGELFGPGDSVVPVAARPVVPLGMGARVTLACVGDEYVAVPLQGGTVSRARVPSGWLTGRRTRRRPGAGQGDPAPRAAAADPGGCGL